MPINYEEKFKTAYQHNVQNVREAVRQGKLNGKIDNFCNLHGFTREHLIQQIESNHVVAACFAINPNKQNFYEKMAADFIKNIKGVKNFEMLSNNKLIVQNGAVIPKSALEGGYPSAKTLDFRWMYQDMTFYASHKYTKQEGGSQENQHKDLREFISQAAPTSLRDTYFVAIADGAFYQMQDKQDGMSRIQKLKSLASSDKVFACTIGELENLMKQIVGK